ncbi:MAG: protein kinase [Cyanobacteria bacterium SZAS LIN-2]|nr:protein kinase [Cyanobacteria bacterium SZAS LIN-2]
MSDNDDAQDRTVSLETDSKPTRLLRPGDIVGGHYELKSIIGRGGMGLVFLAEHSGLHKQYALKALAPERSSETNWQRFKNEGIAIGRLDHPNIVKVYDMGVDGSDCLYYVMDLLDGIPLSDLIRKQGVLELKETLAIFRQLCAGLGYAHKRGLVHRDIKPNNIIMCKPGPGQPSVQVKLIDFGLVKLVGQDSYLVQSQTRAGMVCGSPFYMSPEQCRGGRIDERSDIYSLGCTLFECLTGEPPFCGKTGLETAVMHENSPPPALNDFRPDKRYPQNLEQVVARMLEKTPGKRYQSAEQVAQDLERVRLGQPVNREAVNYIQGVSASESEDDDDGLSDHAAREKRMLVLVACLGVLLTVGVVWGAVTFFNAKPGKPMSSSLLTSTGLTKEQVDVRKMFDEWPQISSGVVEKDNARCRLFNCPPVPLGIISWGPESGQKELAKGEVQAPPDKPLTLLLPRPEGLYPRMFPQILTKFRPDDFWALEVKESQNPIADTVILSDITPELIHSVAGWTALRKIDFYHCHLKKETIKAFDELPYVNELRLHNSSYDPADLAKLKWLKRVEIMDIKGCGDADLVVKQVAGSPNLRELSMDCTAPTVAAFRGLATCPNLSTLSLSECDLSAEAVAAISNISSLEELTLNNDEIRPNMFAGLSKLKRLRRIGVPYFEGQDFLQLRAAVPHAIIKMDRRHNFRI